MRRRRRARLVLESSSSDEEEDDKQRPSSRPQEENQVEIVTDSNIETLNNGFRTVTVNPSHHSPHSDHPLPIDISDDDYVDASNRISPTNLSPDSLYDHSSSPITNRGGHVDEIGHFLLRFGLNLRNEWLDSCITSLDGAVTGFASLDVAAKAKACLGQFLSSDMNSSGAGVLPPNVASMHLVDLPGPFVLQVDEIVNISRPLKERHQNVISGIMRCLKFSMTDGVQRVFGMEYRPIKDFEVMSPAGIKVLVCNVHVRRGLFLLVPETVEILGGLVDDLESAKLRLIHEINKPPRGKRTRNGAIQPLRIRAMLAAWPEETNAGSGNSNNSVSIASDLFQHGILHTGSDQRVNTDANNIHSTPINELSAYDNISSDAFDVEDLIMDEEFEAEEMRIRDDDNDGEIPFTYLASLSAKCAALGGSSTVKGTIKCFLTGVKKFQYKKRETFELRVHVDDGSLISEVMIDHKVVEKGIGCSPEEVTAALASSHRETALAMKQTLKRFQIYLSSFEGTMVIEMNGGGMSSSIPTALEMTQGCPVSFSRLLLTRVALSFPPCDDEIQLH